MNEESREVLTIDVEATKAKIKADGRTVESYARLRGLVRGTFGRIMCGHYPATENPGSEYQKALRQLKDDGYLVEAAGHKAQAA